MAEYDRSEVEGHYLGGTSIEEGLRTISRAGDWIRCHEPSMFSGEDDSEDYEDEVYEDESY